MNKKMFLISSAEKLLLDKFPGAQFAFAFFLLRKAYAGYCIRVRRSLDNSLLDIGFVNGVLDTATLLTFAAGGNAFIHTKYDQGLNGYNSVEANPANQAQIVSSGSVLMVNGLPSMWGRATTTTNMLITLPAGASTTPQSYFGVFRNRNTLNSTSFVIPYGTLNGANYFGVCENGSVSSPQGNFTNPNYYKNGTLLTSVTRDMLYDNIVTNNLMVISALGGGDLGTITTRFLQYTSAGFYGNFDVSAVINYHSDQSANRVAIENYLKAFYSI